MNDVHGVLLQGGVTNYVAPLWILSQIYYLPDAWFGYLNALCAGHFFGLFFLRSSVYLFHWYALALPYHMDSQRSNQSLKRETDENAFSPAESQSFHEKSFTDGSSSTWDSNLESLLIQLFADDFLDQCPCSTPEEERHLSELIISLEKEIAHVPDTSSSCTAHSDNFVFRSPDDIPASNSSKTIFFDIESPGFILNDNGIENREVGSSCIDGYSILDYLDKEPQTDWEQNSVR